MMTPSADVETWIRIFHPAPNASVRLICFPHAGGAASFFFAMSKALSPDIEVLAVQYPGRQDRRGDPTIPTIPGMVEQSLPAIRQCIDRPTAFFGHSMGATIGYELGLRLERENVELVRFFASARRGPSRYRDDADKYRTDEKIVAELLKLSGTEASLLEDPELISMIMPAIRSDYRAVMAYRHDPDKRLASPVTVLVGDADPNTSIDEAKAWSEHASGPFDLRVLPGGHFYLSEQLATVLSVVCEQTGVDVDAIAKRISSSR